METLRTKLLLILLGIALFLNITYSNHSSQVVLSGTTDNLSLISISEQYITAKPGSTITWNVNDSPGGHVALGNAIASVIVLAKQNRHIHTKFVVHGYCHSMCGLLASLSDSIVVDDNVPFIFHAFQTSFLIFHGVDSTSSVFKAHMRFWDPYIKRILTPEEYQGVLDGKDIIVLGSRIKAAINRK